MKNFYRRVTICSKGRVLFIFQEVKSFNVVPNFTSTSCFLESLFPRLSTMWISSNFFILASPMGGQSFLVALWLSLTPQFLSDDEDCVTPR